jgi:hypothetical protein
MTSLKVSIYSAATKPQQLLGRRRGLKPIFGILQHYTSLPSVAGQLPVYGVD